MDLKSAKIVASLGLAMIVSGFATIGWGGILLDNNTIGLIGSIVALVGIVTLSRRM